MVLTLPGNIAEMERGWGPQLKQRSDLRRPRREEGVVTGLWFTRALTSRSGMRPCSTTVHVGKGGPSAIAEDDPDAELVPQVRRHVLNPSLTFLYPRYSPEFKSTAGAKAFTSSGSEYAE